MNAQAAFLELSRRISKLEQYLRNLPRPEQPKRERKQVWGDAAPTSGTWSRGDIVYHRSPSAGGYIGWVCVEGGSNGSAVWKPFGQIST